MIKETLRKIHAKVTHFPFWVDIFFLALVGIFIMAGIFAAPFHGDETDNLWMSGDYDRILKLGKLSTVLNNDTDGTIRLVISPFFSFWIGLGRDVLNIEISELPNRWVWKYEPWDGDRMWEENIEQGSMPDTSLLNMARAISAGMASLGVVFFFLLARRLLVARIPVWTAVILIATHGVLLVNVRRAMQEGSKFLGLSILLYVVSGMLHTSERTKRSHILLGLASGLAFTVKQDTFITLSAIYIVLILISIWEKEPLITPLLYLCASISMAFAVFILLMPVFWHWIIVVPVLVAIAVIFFQLPSSRWKVPLVLSGFILVVVALWLGVLKPIEKMQRARAYAINSQVQYRIEHGLYLLDTLDKRVDFLLKALFESDIMYMESPRFDIDPIRQQIAEYEASPFRGRINTFVLDVFVVVLFMLGSWTYIKPFTHQSFLVFSLLVVPMILLLWLVPLAWQRYFWILQIPYSLIAGAGAGQVWEWLKKLKAKSLHLETEAGSS